MYPYQKTRVIPLAFLIALTAGCAHQQQPPQPSESERLAAAYPDAETMTIARSDESGPRVVATGLDQATHEVEPDVYRDRDASRVEVMRGGRYALVTANATLQQRNLLEQTINISIPASMDPSVEDGLRYTLQHTGYSLCAPQGKPQELLYSRPLPAAHFRLGPMPLREALQVLAGSAFEVQADPIARTICYQVRDQRLIEEISHDG
ncbi:PilL N-terminal domain-containing protein [Salinicola sp. JS01]|uniref:PFGI-1 class ICE element type IV pilus protein PilL2 n=1 Tax=Salinicola sp. JS01 TaxID=3050071 RepID=UPI00255B77D3|nr:PilL N-terminal domain-containing protein [Salinicola sp. JS01]WIX33234.1 PilL N-terminal domain-containing protein [Salinicola sp. JS01]